MMETQKKDALTTDKYDRRRGRPAGKNRTPLSLEERRARNAQYERERRTDTADAMTQLAEAASCHPQIGNAELLATVISQLQRRSKRKLPEDIEDLKRVNENLESQIAALQSRLEIAEDSNDCDHLSETSEPNSPTIDTKVRRKSDFQSRKRKHQRSKKIPKTSKSSSTRQKLTFETDESPNHWSESVETTRTTPLEPTLCKLQKRSRKVSEQSEVSTTSTCLFRTESESSQCGMRPLNSEVYSEDSNPSDVEKHPTNATLSATTEHDEEYAEHHDAQTETGLLETLTEGGKIINQWLDCSETVNVTDHDNQVRKFLDFDDFLLDINT